VIADSVAGQKERLEKNTEDLNKFKTTYDKELNDYKALIAPREQTFYDETMAAYKEYIKSYEEEFAMVKEGKGVEALNHYNSIGHLAVFKLIEKVTNETAFNTEGAEGSTKQGSNLTSITNWTMTIVLICSLIISTIIIIVILKLTNTINGSIESLKKQGDSTMKISKILMQSSQSLSESVTEQAASVHETTAAINEITSMVNKTSENAQESNVVAKDASQKAESRKQPRDHEKIGK